MALAAAKPKANSFAPARSSTFLRGSGIVRPEHGPLSRGPATRAPPVEPAEARKKPWETTPVNDNGKPIRRKMHVHTGDTVQVTAGKDKGKVSEVVKVFRKTGQVIVRDVNLKWRYEMPQREGEKGRMYQTEGPIDHSNVMLYSKEHQRRSRVGRTVTSDGRKKRYLVKTGEILED